MTPPPLRHPFPMNASPPEPPNESQRELRLAVAALVVVGAMALGWVAIRYVTRHPLVATPARATPLPRTQPDVVPSPMQPPADAVLSLLPITREEKSHEFSTERFALHIPIKSPPDMSINVRDLTIHVLFYDIVDGENVVQTSANVNSRWENPPADWKNSDTEHLTVEYELPKPRDTDGKIENRKYYGYLVRLYYQKRLQGFAGEPQRLLQQYPPLPTLPSE